MPEIVDQKADLLLTVDEVRERLSLLEPLETMRLDKSNPPRFSVDPEWALMVDALRNTDAVDVYVKTDGENVQLTKEAFSQLCKEAGLPFATVKKVPHDAVEQFLNRVYSFAPKDLKVLSVDGVASAVSRATLTQFSTLRLFNSVIERLEEKYGDNLEVYVDYKIDVSFSRTDLRLILVNESNYVHTEDGSELWSAGIHLSNSLTGQTQTYVDSYFFRWEGLNGLTIDNPSAGHWDRRKGIDDGDDVYQWVAESAMGALSESEELFRKLEALSKVYVHDPAGVLEEVFSEFKLPARQRLEILERVSRQYRPTLYSVMLAVSASANGMPQPVKDVERILRICGEMTGEVTWNAKNARIWNAGHFAPSGAPNPFDLLGDS